MLRSGPTREQGMVHLTRDNPPHQTSGRDLLGLVLLATRARTVVPTLGINVEFLLQRFLFFTGKPLSLRREMCAEMKS